MHCRCFRRKRKKRVFYQRMIGHFAVDEKYEYKCLRRFMSSNKMNSKRQTPRNTVITLSKAEDKEKINKTEVTCYEPRILSNTFNRLFIRNFVDKKAMVHTFKV
jgi:hypothetical protein